MGLTADDPQLAYILQTIPTDRALNVLDAGCGDGRYSLHLASLGYKHLHAVDLFDKPDIPGVEYVSASIDLLPYKDNSFDFIFCNSVIFYVDPPEKALREFRRVLKTDGTVVITAHTKWSLFTLWRIIKRDILRQHSMEHLAGVKFYSAEYYRKALINNGFEISLRDEWRLSSILHPTYRLIGSAIRKAIGLALPLKKPYITQSEWLAWIKSEIAYHSVFIAVRR